MSFRYLLLLSLSTCLFSADPGWPQFRGPERTGAAPGAPWPGQLKELRQLWQVKLDKGYPGPIVDASRVYVAETATSETEIVRALDRKTGKETVARLLGRGSTPFRFSPKRMATGFARPPPSTGQTLFVAGMEEVLVACNTATGKEKWRVDFPKRYNVAKPDFGFSSSPLLDGDSLIVQAANSVIRLNKKTGATEWRALPREADIMDSGAFSSPTIASLHGRRQLLVQSRTNLYGLDPATGAVLWQQEVPHYQPHEHTDAHRLGKQDLHQFVSHGLLPV